MHDEELGNSLFLHLGRALPAIVPGLTPIGNACVVVSARHIALVLKSTARGH